MPLSLSRLRPPHWTSLGKRTLFSNDSLIRAAMVYALPRAVVAAAVQTAGDMGSAMPGHPHSATAALEAVTKLSGKLCRRGASAA